jgi:hypothetical protein
VKNQTPKELTVKVKTRAREKTTHRVVTLVKERIMAKVKIVIQAVAQDQDLMIKTNRLKLFQSMSKLLANFKVHIDPLHTKQQCPH